LNVLLTFIPSFDDRWVDCNAKDATVVWQPTGENKAPILAFIIQFSTSFNPDTWETATGKLLIDF